MPRLQKAGKRVGSGSQGCVYSPPLQCQPSSAPLPEGDLVSKYTLQPYAIEEIEILKLLQPADPTQAYSVYSIHNCVPAEEQIEPLSECLIQRYNPEIPRHILNYPNGGEDLFSMLVPVTYWIYYFEEFLNLIRGLAHFHAHNIVHMDIKPENMVGKWDLKKGSYVLRFIDFGFAFSTKDPRINEAYGYWNRNYSVWPYELRFLNPIFTEEMITEESVQQYLNDSYFNRYQTLPISIYNTQTVKLYKDIWRRCKEMPYSQKLDTLAKSADVYALGRALSFMYASTTDQYCTGDDVYYSIPTTASSAEITFQENIRKYVSNRFYVHFIKRLIDPDPFTRPESHEVEALYKPILESMRMNIRKPPTTRNQFTNKNTRKTRRRILKRVRSEKN